MEKISLGPEENLLERAKIERTLITFLTILHLNDSLFFKCNDGYCKL